MITTSAGLTRLQWAPHQHSKQNSDTNKTTRIFLFLCGKRRETGFLKDFQAISQPRRYEEVTARGQITRLTQMLHFCLSWYTGGVIHGRKCLQVVTYFYSVVGYNRFSYKKHELTNHHKPFLQMIWKGQEEVLLPRKGYVYAPCQYHSIEYLKV